MKKTFISLFFIVLVLIFAVANAEAWNLSIEPSASPYMIAPGTTSVFFDIVFNPDSGGNMLGNYGFNLYYDNNELTWNLAASKPWPTLPSPLSAQIFGDPWESSPGHIENISGLLFPPNATPPTITAPLTLITLAFDVTPGMNVGTGDGLADIWFDTMSSGGNMHVDGKSYWMQSSHSSGDIVPVLSGPDVAVTPEPVSSVLFVIGGATLGFRRFVRRK